MRDSKEIITYVSEMKNHFIGVKYQGRLKKSKYFNSTIYKDDEFGVGAFNCVQELYLTEKVVYAFTCFYADGYSVNDDDFENAMVCLTDNARVIVGLEDRYKSFESNLTSYDLKRIKKKDYYTDSYSHYSIISIGYMNFKLKQSNRNEVDQQATKILKMVFDIVKNNSDN